MKLTVTNQQSKPVCTGVGKLSHHLKGRQAATFFAVKLNKTGKRLSRYLQIPRLFHDNISFKRKSSTDFLKNKIANF